MSQNRILIIDDESSIRSSLQGILEDEGYEVAAAATGEDGLQQMQGRDFDLILLDIWLPEMSGLDVLHQIRGQDDPPQVVVISGHGTVETAVQATRLGAFDFLEKPLTLEKVVLTVKNALRQHRLEEENVQLRRNIRARHYLVGMSPALRRIRLEIKKAAPTDGRVLITGESGVGKELAARLLHGHSRRRRERFLEVNCAAIPAELIESELFGQVRGGSSGTAKDKKGKLQMADGGTLFLDEVGFMPLTVQARLVKAISEGRCTPVGASEPVAFDSRILASSTRSLKERIAHGEFREDLFFKLNTIPLSIPPLRERIEDIPPLINYFLRYFSNVYGKRPKKMGREPLKTFLNYSWPGNVSELMNVMERFVILVEEEEIGTAHLILFVETREQEAGGGMPPRAALRPALAEFERRHIHRALLRSRWDLSRAAAELDIPRDELQAKIKDLRITLDAQ